MACRHVCRYSGNLMCFDAWTVLHLHASFASGIFFCSWCFCILYVPAKHWIQRRYNWRCGHVICFVILWLFFLHDVSLSRLCVFSLICFLVFEAWVNLPSSVKLPRWDNFRNGLCQCYCMWQHICCVVWISLSLKVLGRISHSLCILSYWPFISFCSL